MERYPLNTIQDEQTRLVLQDIYEKAKDEKISIFESEPTLSELSEGQEAFYNDRIYRNVNGILYYYSLTAV